jgi:hypothetical protein
MSAALIRFLSLSALHLLVACLLTGLAFASHTGTTQKPELAHLIRRLASEGTVFPTLKQTLLQSTSIVGVSIPYSAFAHPEYIFYC